MKYVGGAFLILFCAFVGLRAVLLLLPSDVVTSWYASLEAARSDRLFERGWLPDILPLSTHNLRTSNNVALNGSEGEFSFTPSDYASLVSHLRPYETIHPPFVDFEQSVVQMRGKGFQPTIYVQGGSTWVFFCKPEVGYCKYTLRTSR